MTHSARNAAPTLPYLVALLLAVAGCSGGGDGESTATTPAAQRPNGINQRPTISGNPPPAASVGNTYSFVPNASDPDGDSLTFSVQNLPSWASFDTATGELSGVASNGAEGEYGGIRISVTDGQLSSSTPDFSIRVTQSALGSVTLTWTPPTQNSDGSPLADLTAYKVYYGTSQGNYPNEIRIDNPGISSYVVDNLVPDTYYFVSTTMNSLGVESDYSNVATKVVD